MVKHRVREIGRLMSPSKFHAATGTLGSGVCTGQKGWGRWNFPEFARSAGRSLSGTPATPGKQNTRKTSNLAWVSTYLANLRAYAILLCFGGG